ncbi:MAG TPA: hypothetical protein VFW63_03050 [Acidimicrobiales bacterium]|nr:hypothetical protein [Acidimicrobiales bacterium]
MSDHLVAVAAHGLAGSRADLPSAALDDAAWFDLVQGCALGGLVGLLAAAGGHGLAVTPGQAEELAVLAAEHAGASALVERQVATTASVLALSGVDHRVVDGPARRLAEGHPAARPPGVVTVLVAPEDLEEARALQGPPGRGDRGGGRGRVVVVAAVPGLERAPGGLWSLLGPGAALDVDGRTLRALTVEQQLVVACAVLGAAPVPTLGAWRDIAELALAPALDPSAVRRLAQAAGVLDALGRGVAGAWRWFDLADKTELSVWATRRTGPPAGGPGGRPPPSSPVGLARRVLGRRPAAAPLHPPGGAPLAGHPPGGAPLAGAGPPPGAGIASAGIAAAGIASAGAPPPLPAGHAGDRSPRRPT